MVPRPTLWLTCILPSLIPSPCIHYLRPPHILSIMNPAALNHPCLVCGRPTSQWCSRCRAAFYCSPEHLQSVRLCVHLRVNISLFSPQDWPHHRERCRHSAPYVSNMIVTLPSVELDYVSVSAIFFLTDEGALVLCHTPRALIFLSQTDPK
jgi:hypothetical protein